MCERALVGVGGGVLIDSSCYEKGGGVRLHILNNPSSRRIAAEVAERLICVEAFLVRAWDRSASLMKTWCRVKAHSWEGGSGRTGLLVPPFLQ